jgi:hypothetical protein
MRTLTDVGSLRIMPKDPKHVSGDGNDGDTTIMHKALAMAHGISLPKAQELSMRRHNDARNASRWAIGIACVGIVILATRYVGALAWIERTLR